MSDSLYELFGDDAALARARADAMSKRARSAQNAGLILRTLAGERDPTGGLLTQQGQREQAQLGAMVPDAARIGASREQHRMSLEAQQARQAVEDSQWGQQFGESSRHNRAMEAKSAPPLQIVTGSGGQLLYADPRNPTRPAQPIVGPEGPLKSPKPPQDVKAAGNMRREFQALPAFKSAQIVAEAWEKIKTTGDSGAGDMSLVYGYMKILDPGSSVKEGEYATAEKAGSVPARIVALYNKSLTGEKLAPEVRGQFRTEAAKVYNAQVGRYKATADQYRRLAEKQGLAPDDVVLDVGLKPVETGAAPGGAQPAPQRAQGKDGKWYVNSGGGWEAE